MEEVQKEIMRAVYEVYDRYLTEDIKSGKYPAYKASGMEYSLCRRRKGAV
ncbi:MAG: hypothetical protein HFE30_09665 [Clostridiales bacterium]|nr:hypothetical protein [Clostridiales bacterium]